MAKDSAMSARMAASARSRAGRDAAARRWPRPSRRLGWALCSVGAVLLAWVATTWVWPVVDPGRFPSPPDVYQAALQLSSGQGYAGGTLSAHVWQSSKLVLVGFAVASAVGIPLGLLMGWSRRAEALLNPTFLLLRPIPPLAWIPLAILWFGLGDSAKVFVIFFAAFVPAVINAYTGVRGIDRTLVAAARVHGASTPRLFVAVLVPGALPSIFTGLRLALQASWTTLVAAELVGALLGLGHVLVIASLDIYPGMILYAMVWVGIMGGLMTAALGWIERRVMPWRR
jgi:NitT/TauT family transport system permease protein/taurine transport system permease protein